MFHILLTCLKPKCSTLLLSASYGSYWYVLIHIKSVTLKLIFVDLKFLLSAFQ